MNFNKLFISAGGINGYIFIGILKYLDENKYLNKINKYFGCSVGSILCFLLSINYSVEEIEKIFLKLNVDNLLNDFNINLFIKYKCVYNNYKIVNYIKELISNKGINNNITLKEHYEMFNKKICFVVSNITTNKCEYITHKNYPNLKLWKAILMSISIPIIFPSVKYNDNFYVDGALYDQLGLYKIKQKYIKDNNMIVITFINDINKSDAFINDINKSDAFINDINKNKSDAFINDINKNKSDAFINNDENDKLYDLIKYIGKCSYTFINENVNNNKNILLKDYKYFYCYINYMSNDKISNYFNLVLSEEKKIEMINNGYNYAISKDI